MNAQLQTPPQSPQYPPAMVSHPEIAERDRRTPSTSSRTTRSRHHRGRSHHGGSTYVPQNEFPFFAQTGDVEIVISADGQEKKYLLHKLILAQCSGFFDAGTSEEWARGPALRRGPAPPSGPGQALSRIGEDAEEGQEDNATPIISPEAASQMPLGSRRWKYVLDWENTDEDEEPMLVQKTPSAGPLFGSDFTSPQPPPPRPRPLPSQSGGFFRSMANLTLGTQSAVNLSSTLPPTDPALLNPMIRDYDNLFRIFYNYSPSLNSTNIAAAYSESKSLLGLADMYDALPVVGSRIDHHLLRFSSRLFKQIAKYPPSYLKLGYLARSRVIFAEALIHVVGQWPFALPYLKGVNTGYEVPDTVIELIEDKFDEMEETKAKVESKLFRLTITTSRGERVNPANDYLGWLALSLFRQWLAENTTPPPAPILKNSPSATRPGHHNNDGVVGNPTVAGQNAPPRSGPPPPPVLNTGRVYRIIGSTNSQAYLPHDELKRFLKLHPSSENSGIYTRDNLRRFERKIDEVKNIARDLVKPLIRNFLDLDMRGENGGGLPYLTCCKVEDEDFPWD